MPIGINNDQLKAFHPLKNQINLPPLVVLITYGVVFVLWVGLSGVRPFNELISLLSDSFSRIISVSLPSSWLILSSFIDSD